jgi:hypothetical protein
VEAKMNLTKQLGIPNYHPPSISYLPQAQTLPDIVGQCYLFIYNTVFAQFSKIVKPVYRH